jgi:hypothetical protein
MPIELGIFWDFKKVYDVKKLQAVTIKIRLKSYDLIDKIF